MATTDILLLLSQILVAVGTITLAIFTYLSIKNSESQLKYLREQTKILKNDKFPLLKIFEKKYKENLITLKIKNIGEKSAFKIGLETNFLLAQHYISDDKKSISFGFDSGQIFDITNGNPKIKSNGYVVWNNKRKTISLPPAESEILSFTPKFGVLYGTEADLFKFKTFGRSFDLNELTKIIKGNGKKLLEIEMNLVYQDYAGDLKERVPLFRYIFDVDKDKTFEDCFKRKWEGNLTAIGPNETEIRMDGEFSFLYNTLRDPKKDVN